MTRFWLYFRINWKTFFRYFLSSSFLSILVRAFTAVSLIKADDILSQKLEHIGSSFLMDSNTTTLQIYFIFIVWFLIRLIIFCSFFEKYFSYFLKETSLKSKNLRIFSYFVIFIILHIPSFYVCSLNLGFLKTFLIFISVFVLFYIPKPLKLLIFIVFGYIVFKIFYLVNHSYFYLLCVTGCPFVIYLVLEKINILKLKYIYKICSFIMSYSYMNLLLKNPFLFRVLFFNIFFSTSYFLFKFKEESFIVSFIIEMILLSNLVFSFWVSRPFRNYFYMMSLKKVFFIFLKHYIFLILFSHFVLLILLLNSFNLLNILKFFGFFALIVFFQNVIGFFTYFLESKNHSVSILFQGISVFCAIGYGVFLFSIL